MPKSFHNYLLVVAVATTPFVLTACGDGDGSDTNQKFSSALVKVISTPATSIHLDYQALLFRNE